MPLEHSEYSNVHDDLESELTQLSADTDDITVSAVPNRSLRRVSVSVVSAVGATLALVALLSTPQAARLLHVDSLGFVSEASADPNATLFTAKFFTPYQAYNGSLTTDGIVTITPSVAGSTSEMFTWTLKDVDPLCSGTVAQSFSCGMLITAGTECTQDTGASFYASYGSDPYLQIVYTEQLLGFSTGTKTVATGLTPSQLIGRTMILTDSASQRIACAVIEEGALQPPAGTCFPRTAMARVEGRGSVALEDLVVGDNIFVQSETGEFTYEPLIGFLHSTRSPSSLLSVTHAGGEFQASANHLVFVASAGGQTSKLMSELRVGEQLLLAPKEAGGKSVSSSILAIRTTIDAAGVLAPLTASGSIVVNGVVASVYASHSSKVHLPHCALHAVFFPVRMLSRLAFGRFVSGPAAREQTFEKMHPYAEFWQTHIYPVAKSFLSI